MHEDKAESDGILKYFYCTKHVKMCKDPLENHKVWCLKKKMCVWCLVLSLAGRALLDRGGTTL